MYRIACPSCGADVEFKSEASAMAVCAYCQSTLLRSADSVRDIGKMAALLNDYSPLQITSCGQYMGRGFSVVGRIQLRYDAGLWNEWYLLFDDGGDGWLSESVGQYTLTLAVGAAPQAAGFEQQRPGAAFRHDKVDFVVSDVRAAECTAGEGELPFQVGAGWQAKVVDARRQAQFLTLDYSDNPQKPQLFLGNAVTLPQLRMERLRDARMIEEATGKLKGSVASLECPSCAAPLSYRAGTATQLICGHCHTQVDASGDQALALSAAQQRLDTPLTLELGKTATIDKLPWTLTGALVWAEEEDADSRWCEYLLYNVDKGFRWLVESGDGWFIGELMDVWVDSLRADYAMLGNKAYQRAYPDYAARIVYAAGAFPWRAQLGDQVLLSEYQISGGQKRLSRELSAQELNWSCSSLATSVEVGRWFGSPTPIEPGFSAAEDDGGDLKAIAVKFGLVLLLINLPLALLSQDIGDGLLICFFACCVLAIPLKQKD
ncbi:DUF4178 domain-containing protein [Chromobacterium alkanivorans]|uniref:DUF4178 domain-containing protein n=1 Tax=Chromobacterium alkanivorans TaxID=1071719 RepID=UPI0019689CA3|nr:DUF4178 domain-containing protein [Chromobacterium alkanivorans]MBN3004821.1 DUF4178 domain-containing protein [Chromobacterium alkanivorans]